jgi:hypothetical protein
VVQPVKQAVKTVYNKAVETGKAFVKEVKKGVTYVKEKAAKIVEETKKFVCTTANKIKDFVEDIDWKTVGKVLLDVGIIVAITVGTGGVGAALTAPLLIGMGGDLLFTAADIQEDITGKNFMKDTVFGGNDTAYNLAGLAVGLVNPAPGSELKYGAKLLAKNGDELLDAGKSIGKAITKTDDVADAKRILTSKVDNAFKNTVQDSTATVNGTKIHKSLSDLIPKEGIKTGTGTTLVSEKSYKAGEEVAYGTKGSVRLDVPEKNGNNIVAIYDLKTGESGLSSTRVDKIRKEAGVGLDVPVYEVRKNSAGSIIYIEK